MRPILIALALALLLAGCAHRPGLGSYADAATTYVVVASPNFVEANPLLSWGTPVQVALASIALKQLAKEAVTAAGAPADLAHRSVETAGLGAAGWNLAHLLGAASPWALVTGLGAGLWYWVSGDA